MTERDMNTSQIVPVNRDGLHVQWGRILGALHEADVALELRRAQLDFRLGARVAQGPDAGAIMSLLDGYYRGDGDVEAGLRRMREDRWVVRRVSDPNDVPHVLASLQLAAPECGPVTLVSQGRGAARRWLLRAPGAVVPVPEVEDRFGVPDRDEPGLHISVAALVAAVNRLLAVRDAFVRLFPLVPSEDAEAWIGLNVADALVLESVGLLAQPVVDLRAFAALAGGPLVTVGARAAG